MAKDWWDELQATLEAFPRFKFNCFIQAKRPERMVRSDATEYIHWNKPYFRYDTCFAQQTALARLASLTSGRAIVTYACPAFWEKADLWRTVESDQIIENSNFCEVERLTSHSRYSFVSPGNMGIAHSEPEHIESVPFQMALRALNNLDAAESNVTFIIETANLIHDAGQRMGKYSQIFSHIERTIFKGIENKLARSLGRLIAFRFSCDVQILIGSEIRNG